MSESFTNDGARASASFDAGNGQQVTGTGTQGAAPVTFSYDASSNSYTVTAGGLSQTFGSGTLTQQSPAVNVYTVVNGATTDTLTLTRPGTSGRFNYQYVGAGYWQRTVQGASSVDGTLTGFTYGVETPDADLPRTGTATYAIDLLGALTQSGEEGVLSINGSGSLVANFLSGAIDVNARFKSFRADGSAISNATSDGNFSASAQLSSTGNSFSGTGSAVSFGTYTGAFNGRFYGPTAGEVGAVFSGLNENGYIFSAAILGRRSGTGTTLATLTSPTTFKTGLVAALYTDTGSGLVLDTGAMTAQLNTITYDPTTQSYTFLSSPGNFDYFGRGQFTVAPSDRDAARDTADFTAYVGGTPEDELQVDIFKGQVNGVELTYSSFARVTGTKKDAGGNITEQSFTFVPFGILTPRDQIPVAGTASYSGRIFGSGRDASGQLAYELGGTSTLTIDFGAFQVTGFLMPTGRSLTGGADMDFGSLAISGTVDSTFNGFFGTIDGNGSQTITGWFYGPSANEYGAIWNAFSGDVSLDGVTVGTKD